MLKISKGQAFVMFVMILVSSLCFLGVNNLFESSPPFVEYKVDVPRLFNASYLQYKSVVLDHASVFSMVDKTGPYVFLEFPYSIEDTANVGVNLRIEIDYFGGTINEIDGLNVEQKPTRDLLGEQTFFVEVALEDNHEVNRWNIPLTLFAFIGLLFGMNIIAVGLCWSFGVLD